MKKIIILLMFVSSAMYGQSLDTIDLSITDFGLPSREGEADFLRNEAYKMNQGLANIDGFNNFIGVTDSSAVLEEITYSDTYWDDLFISTGLFRFAGVNDPVWRDWQPGGSGVTFQAMFFDKDDEIYFSCQMPHSYKEGTEIHAHVHWTPGTRGNEESGSYVGWKLAYTIANINGDAFGVSDTLDMSDTCTGTDHYHEVSAASTTIPGTYGTGDDLTVSHMIVCKLFRSDTGADDTWTGTTTQAPAILQFDFHHEKSTPGSSQQWVK